MVIFILSRLHMVHVWHVITHTHTPLTKWCCNMELCGQGSSLSCKQNIFLLCPSLQTITQSCACFSVFLNFSNKIMISHLARFMFYSFPKATILQYFPQNRYSINTCKTNDVSKPQINIKHFDWKTTILLNERSPHTTFKLSASFHFTPIYLEMKKKNQ